MRLFKIKPLILIFLILSIISLHPSTIMAQTVAVTGTITDTQTTPYSNGLLTVTFVNATGQLATFGGNPSFQKSYAIYLDANGAFTISLPPNSTASPSIQPSGTQWNFSYQSQGGYGAANINVTITGAGSISGTLSNLARITWPYGNIPPPGATGQGIVFVSSTTLGWGTTGTAGAVTHTAGNLTALHLMLGNGIADSTVDSACVTNGTGALSGCTSISAGSGASAAGATATGGFAAVEAASTGWTPTAGQDYCRADSTLHSFVCAENGAAEVLIGNVNTGQTNVYGAFLQDFTAGTMELPEAAGFTTNVNSTIGLDTTNNNVHEFVNGADSFSVVEAAAVVANTIPKATDSTHSLVTASSMIDNGTSVTSTDTGGFVAPVFVANGSTAGFVDYPQGTTSAAVAPCNVATSICEQAPAAVTYYLLNKLAGPSSGIKLESNAASVLTETSSGDANHSVHVTAQTATKTIYTLCPASAGGCNVAGQYRVTWYFNQGGTACGTPTPGQVTFALSWTDNAGAHSAIALPMNDNSSIAVFTSAFKFAATNVTGFASGEINIWSTGAQPIQVTNTYTACGVGTGTWELTAAVEQVQ